MEIITKEYLTRQFNLFMQTLKDKFVLKENNKGLSSNDFSNDYKHKVEVLNNYDDKEIKSTLSQLKAQIDALPKEKEVVVEYKSDNQFTEEYKEKLESLKNYDDTSLVDLTEKLLERIITLEKTVNELDNKVIKSVEKDATSLVFIFKNNNQIKVSL